LKSVEAECVAFNGRNPGPRPIFWDTEKGGWGRGGEGGEGLEQVTRPRVVQMLNDAPDSLQG